MAERIRLACPKCGGEDISAFMEAFGLAPVFEWKRQRDGALTPADIGRPDDYTWEIADRRNQFACDGCKWEGNADDLKVSRS